MKAFDSIRRSAGAVLSIVVLTILSSAVQADTDIFPAELLTEQASFTNVRGAPVAVDGDYLAAGVNSSLGLPPSVSLFHRVNGTWQFQGTLNVPTSPLTAGFGTTSVSLDGTTLVVGDNYTGDSLGLAYVFAKTDQPAFNAWNTSDNSSGTTAYYRYDYPLKTNEQQLAETEGWTLTIRCRMRDSFGSGSSPSCFVDYSGTPTNRFVIWLGLDDNLNLTATLDGIPQPITLTTNGDGWAAYHTHQIVFDPTNGTADYYFDGVKMNASAWSPTPTTGLDGVRFGNGSSGGKGSMNWNLVELTTHGTNVLASYDAGTTGSSAMAPDPETDGWILEADNHTGSGITNGPVSPDFASEWPLQSVLAPDPDSYFIAGQFGQSVAIAGDTIIVGAPWWVGSDYPIGEAYVFVRNGSNWIKQALLRDNVTWDKLGTSVAIDGDTAVVGAPGLDPGSAYVFVRSGTNWTQQQQLTNATPENGSQFGQSVAIDGNRVAIGAIYENHANNYSGGVHIFDRTNTTWNPQGSFFANDYPSGEQFGQALALKGDIVLASGFYYDRAYVFRLGSTGWVQAASIIYTNNPDASVRSVAYDGTNYVVSEGEQETGPYGAVHVYTIIYDDPNAVANFVDKLLYYPAAEASGTYDPNVAAFRYKQLLYAADTNSVFARFDQMSSLYGQAERDRADFAESQVAKGLAIHPDDPTLGNLLLDIYYDRSAADAIFANNRQAEADAAHFGPPIANPPPSGEFLIDNEIPLYQQVLDTNRVALSYYFSLLTNHLGVAGDPPLGYQIFQNLVPSRGLMPATYLDTNGVPESVTSNNAALFDGYKDLALLFNLLRDRGNTVDTLGRLLVARNNPGDADQAKSMVSEAQRLLFLQGNLLKSIFPDLPPAGDASGIAEAVQGWSASLTSLAELQQILLGKENLLGFEPDFLMFAPRGNSLTALDSFDRFLSLLDPNDPSSELGVAADRLNTALTTYTQFRGYQDEYAQQAADATSAASGRLAQIVGVPPSDPDYGNYPTGLPGSDLDQQYQSIQLARLRILKNKAEINNVNREVQIELNRAASVSSVLIDYGNRQASLTEQIGQLNAAQAAANQLTDYLNPENLVSGASIAIALNFGVQTEAELAKADLEAQKEKLAGLEQAQIEGINSAAHVKTLLLQLNTLVVDSQEAAVLMRQELGRMAALYREKARLEADLAQSKAELSTRFFADPVHRLTTLADMQTADFAFDEARKWMFYLTRAFDYKWNTTFTNYYLGRSWTDNSVLKCQNASELTDLYLALKNKDETIALNLPAPQEAQTSFSVRQDFFGFLDGQTYVDPATGQTVSAIEAFRRRLRTLLVTNLTDVRLNLEFGTVRQKAGSSFFLGARFDTSGNVVSPGRYLDKINWLKIKISGTNLPSSQTIGDLTYGGTSYIRKQTPGTVDLARPDLVMNEMTAYSTRYWYYDTALNRYRFKDGFTSSGIPIQISPVSGGDPSSLPIYDFTERSVAASGWLLSIELQNRGAEIDSIDDIELFFDHRSVTRQ